MPVPPEAPPASGFVSIAEAAQILHSKPWDVVRLIEDAQVETIQLVEVASLRRFQERR